jgi:hypothetical protein
MSNHLKSLTKDVICFILGRTEKQKDSEMYCDDAYRAKYIVSTSLFSLSSDTNDSTKIQGKSMLTSPYRVNVNNEQYSENGKDNSGESSVEIFDHGYKKSQMSSDKNSLSNKHVSSNEVVSIFLILQ